MKKYILLMLVVLAAGFTSCSNDDIPMEENVTSKSFETTFVVDPSGVIEPFRFELLAGELTVVPSDAQLRLRVLIYNSKGELVDMLTHKQSNYQSVWSVKAQLEAGEYMALAISDVVNTNNPDVTEYWSLKDYENITNAKLLKEPRWAGYQKEILGICHIPFSIGKISNLSINIKPVGAVCYYYVNNYESFPIDVSLGTDMKTNSVFWDSSYELKVDREMEENIFYLNGAIEIPAGKYNYSFSYLLPSQNQNFLFWYRADDTFEVGKKMFILNIKAGDQYFFLCDFHSSFDNYAITERYDVTGMTFAEWNELRSQEEQKVYQNSRGTNNYSKMLSLMKKSDNTIYIKDLIKK